MSAELLSTAEWTRERPRKLFSMSEIGSPDCLCTAPSSEVGMLRMLGSKSPKASAEAEKLPSFPFHTVHFCSAILGIVSAPDGLGQEETVLGFKQHFSSKLNRNMSDTTSFEMVFCAIAHAVQLYLHHWLPSFQ